MNSHMDQYRQVFKSLLPSFILEHRILKIPNPDEQMVRCYQR